MTWARLRISKVAEIELNRKTKRHTLGTDVATDVDFFSNESNPELDISAKEMPSAFIEESYPDYIIGTVGTVQNEMRIFYAPVSELKKKKIKWEVLCKPSDNLVRGFEFHDQYVYAVTHTGAPKYKVVRTSVQHPDWDARRDGRAGGVGFHRSHREVPALSAHRAIPTG